MSSLMSMVISLVIPVPVSKVTGLETYQTAESEVLHPKHLYNLLNAYHLSLLSCSYFVSLAYTYILISGYLLAHDICRG